MAELIIDNLREGYIDLIDFVENEGELVSPRRMKTKEVRNATIVLTDPKQAIPMGVGRKLNMKIGAVETTQLIAGVSSGMQLNLVSNNSFENYMNNGRLLGAYGPRLYAQLENVIKMISRDHDTRQAAALVWRGDESSPALAGNKDVPCTVALSWNVRNGKLNASTVMRSNDVFLGVAYDFWMFTRLQTTLAWALGLEVGDYRHHAVSLHIYERDWGKVNDLEVAPEDPKYPPGFTSSYNKGVSVTNEDQALLRWEFAREAAFGVVTGVEPQGTLDGAHWYYDLLKGHATPETDHLFCEWCRYFYKNDDPTLHEDAACLTAAGIR